MAKGGWIVKFNDVEVVRCHTISFHYDISKCAYCSKAEELSNDHIVPKRERHFAEIHNIVKACKSCNSSKGDKDLIEWRGQFEAQGWDTLIGESQNGTRNIF